MDEAFPGVAARWLRDALGHADGGPGGHPGAIPHRPGRCGRRALRRGETPDHRQLPAVRPVRELHEHDRPPGGPELCDPGRRVPGGQPGHGQQFGGVGLGVRQRLQRIRCGPPLPQPLRHLVDGEEGREHQCAGDRAADQRGGGLHPVRRPQDQRHHLHQRLSRGVHLRGLHRAHRVHQRHRRHPDLGRGQGGRGVFRRSPLGFQPMVPELWRQLGEPRQPERRFHGVWSRRQRHQRLQSPEHLPTRPARHQRGLPGRWRVQ